MKILYGVQGTGNGHITRAMEIIPYLQQKGEVDILVSGIQSDIELPFEVKYRFNGLSFIFGKKGGVDYWKTFVKMNSMKLLKEIKKIDVKAYDLIISDFEPVTCWAALKAKKVCIGLSNQVVTMHPLAPKPKKMDVIGKLVLQNYAPTTYNYGFHFKRLDGTVFTPIIRKEVRQLIPTNDGHYTVYLPSYDDKQIIKQLHKLDTVKWQVFSKHNKEAIHLDNITIVPIQADLFLKSLASAKGVLCNAGFGTPSEALFLKKKVMVIPMKKQIEQFCNAEMLKEMGVAVIKKLNGDNLPKIQKWLEDDTIVTVDYPDNTEEIVNLITENHAGDKKIDTQHESTNYNLFQ
ncbi:glycosyltransferase family protein [Flavobacterium paronense]|uniref:Glycosyltransferase family protein n=1 Tax=Flavobacterium paronense TaxID=1392775 RepID=A0ABV5GCM6_9FLAO|nr:glycosyltransferase family protein [Flavobacterium paronense]MDN3676301.1 glycosyltransferase family protein [Flavobacterium paronense]